MTTQQLRKKTEGFTIIEILIVLAIAGLILLIVFLAIPQIRRNQANTAMRAEVSRVLAAAVEYESNSNGQKVSTNGRYHNVLTGVDRKELLAGEDATNHAYTTGAGGTLTKGQTRITIGTCNGTDLSHDSTSRKYAVKFGLDGGSQACMES